MLHWTVYANKQIPLCISCPERGGKIKAPALIQSLPVWGQCRRFSLKYDGCAWRKGEAFPCLNLWNYGAACIIQCFFFQFEDLICFQNSPTRNRLLLHYWMFRIQISLISFYSHVKKYRFDAMAFFWYIHLTNIFLLSCVEEVRVVWTLWVKSTPCRFSICKTFWKKLLHIIYINCFEYLSHFSVIRNL